MKNSWIANSLLLFPLALLAACSTPDATITTISLEGGDFITISPNAILKDIKLTPLETSASCVLSDWVEFLDHTESFYALDNNKARTLMHFDTDGRFVKSVGQTGKGMGEYLSLYDALLTENGYE